MNGDTPGAVPSDDTPFLGPAISPRRREGGAPTHDTGELAGPFVGRKFGSTAEGDSSSPPGSAEASVPAVDESYDDIFGGDGDAERLEDLPAAEWPEDDFPWLIPAEPEEKRPEGEAPWRATGEVEELTEPEAGAAEPAASGVDHFSWIGERLPEEVAGEAWEPGAPAFGSEAEDDGEAGGFPWDEAPAEEAGAGGFALGGAEGGGFDRGLDAEEAWGEAGEWSPAAAGSAEAEGEPAAAPFDWGEAVEGAGPIAADRWDAGEGFRVEDESGVGGPAEVPEWGDVEPSPASALAAEAEVEAEVEVIAPDAGVAEAEPVAASVEAALEPSEAAAVPGAGPVGPPVETPPLPVGEWEAAPDEGQVEAEPAGGGDPLVDVAERLERIARALRSGRPIEALEGGDPLQLLIAGYALGFSQAKRGRG